MFRSEDTIAPRHGGGALKIGVLTFHRSVNYGSYWQARSLVDGLRGRGHDAVLLDHVSPEIQRAEWRCALQPALPARSSREDIRLYGRKARRLETAIAELPLSPRFPLTCPEAMEPYDLVIVGSDEVWNFSHPWYGGWPVFFGSGLRAQRIVSYAASFGNYDATAGIDQAWSARLERFEAISVRDDNSRQLVGGALGEEPALVLDPCLQFPPAVSPGPEEAQCPASYVAVYGHSFPDELGQIARGWAESRGLPLLSIGYRNRWAHAHCIDAGPHEFARLVAGSCAVITNFFHGCVFALLNAKPFVCLGSPCRMNKVRGLTGMLGAGGHLLPETATATQFAAVLDDPLEAGIAEKLAQLRGQSEAYLRTVRV